MTKHRVKRRPRQHRGVSLCNTARGWVAKWRDPLTGRPAQASLAKLGLPNHDARTDWAIAKAKTLADLRRALSLGTAAHKRVSASEAIEDYLATHANAGTRASKERPLRVFEEWTIGVGVSKKLDALSGQHLVGWRDLVLSGRSTDALQLSTRNRWIVAVGVFLRWCKRRGMVPLLTYDSIRETCGKAPEPEKAIEILRPPQLRQLLQAALTYDEKSGSRWQVAPFVLVLLLSGMRYAEAALLEWAEVDLGAGEIRLPASRVKTKRARTITTAETPTLQLLLEALRRKEPDASLVFHLPSRTTWDTTCTRLVEKHQAPPFTAHTLRRTCGTLLTNAPGIYGGASAWASAKRLGHSVTMAEQRYAGVLRDLPPAAKTLEAAAGIEDLAQQVVGTVG